MNLEEQSKVTFFIGPEVEHTPAYSKKTLFVVGKPEVSRIEKLAREYKVPHISLGANLSFQCNSTEDATYWDTTVTSLLDKGFWVTLNYRAEEHVDVLKILNPGIWQSRIFVPLLGVGIPQLETSNGNLTVKFHSNGNRSTNPGVWSLHYHQITDSNRFTDWGDYDTDVGITETVTPGPTGWSGPLEVKVEDKPTPMPPYMPTSTDPAPERIDIKSLQPAVIKQADAVEPVTSPALNDETLGLDPESKSNLKPDPDAEATIKALDVIDAASAAEAYSEGATNDPLGDESKKPKARKK